LLDSKYIETPANITQSIIFGVMVSLKNIIQYNTENNIDAINIIGSHCVKFQLFWKNLKKNINHIPFNNPENKSQ